MPSKKTTKRSNMNGSGRKGRLTDVPSQAKHTYNTVSCRLPRITASTTIRCQTDNIITATLSSAVASSFNFTLAGAAIGSGFYDRYCIDAVRVSIVPRNNALGLTAGLSDLFCVIDYDDSNVLTSTAQAMGYATCVKMAPGESLSRTFAPRVAVAVYNGTFTGYAIGQKRQWIDAASSSVQHYGLKIYVPATGLSGQTVFQSWDINMEYFISFMNTIG